MKIQDIKCNIDLKKYFLLFVKGDIQGFMALYHIFLIFFYAFEIELCLMC